MTFITDEKGFQSGPSVKKKKKKHAQTQPHTKHTIMHYIHETVDLQQP